MTISRPQARAKLYLSVDGLGVAGTATQIVAQGVTDPVMFQSSAKGAGKWRGTTLYRPTATTPGDITKPATIVATATLSQGSTAYVDQTTLAYEVVGLVSPAELNECIAKALRHVFFPTEVPCSIWPDGDMTAATGVAFTDGGGATSAKTLLPAAGDTVFNSLVVTNGVAGGYSDTTAVDCSPGEELYSAALCRVAGGKTASYGLWDATNNVEIGTAITHTEASAQHVYRVDTIPATCRSVKARLKGTEAGAVTTWDALPSHFTNRRRITGPSFLNAEYKLISFREAFYGAELATGRQVAASRYFTDWHNPSDYQLEVFSPEASPITIQITRDAGVLHRRGLFHLSGPAAMPTRDMWYYARRPWSDINALDDETKTTGADEDFFMAACHYELALILEKRYPAEATWKAMEVENWAVLVAQRAARPPLARRPERQSYTPGGRRSRGSW